MTYLQAPSSALNPDTSPPASGGRGVEGSRLWGMRGGGGEEEDTEEGEGGQGGGRRNTRREAGEGTHFYYFISVKMLLPLASALNRQS